MASLTNLQRDRVRSLHRRLVSIRSVDTSQAQGDRNRAEEAMAAFLTDHLVALGMDVEHRATEIALDWLRRHAARSILD